MRYYVIVAADERKPCAETHWLSFDPVEYATEFAPPPLSSEESGKPISRFFSINDDFRLLVQNGYDYWMICPGGEVNDARPVAIRYFYKGEPGAEEIDLQQAQILALQIAGKPLTTLVDVVVP